MNMAGINEDQLIPYIVRIEALNDEIDGYTRELADIYRDAKQRGFRHELKLLHNQARAARAAGVPFVVPDVIPASQPRKSAHPSRAVKRFVWTDETFVGASVYFAHFPDLKRIKIGISNDYHRRLLGLSRANGAECVVIGTLPGNRAREAEAHRTFSGYRLVGEWFSDACLLLVEEYVRGLQ